MKILSNKENLQILYEDNHIIVVNKRAGDIVQGDKTRDKPLSEVVKDYISEKYNKLGAVYLGVVHRLDRPTTGVVIFAKTSKALSRLNKSFATKDEVQKIYWALVEKAPLAVKDTLTHWLVRNTKQNKSYAKDSEVSDGKKAILSYQMLSVLDNYTLLEIELKTGRHHQIRAQLSSIGSIIKGDLKYGAKRSNPDASISLHARKVKFLHPIRKEYIEIIAPVPDDKLWKIVENLNS